MIMQITKDHILQWLKNSAQLMIEHRDFLIELDSAIGDGDHGLNMSRGFSKVIEKIAVVEERDIGTILKTTGMTLLSQVGGASGPLYGSFFIKGAIVASGKDTLSIVELFAVFKEGVAGVVARGRAITGDKTMCDVWLPILDYFESIDPASPAIEIFDNAAKKAFHLAQETSPMVAKKGRASYLGERSIGHQDPGATSTYYLLLALARALR